MRMIGDTVPVFSIKRRTFFIGNLSTNGSKTCFTITPMILGTSSSTCYLFRMQDHSRPIVVPFPNVSAMTTCTGLQSDIPPISANGAFTSNMREQNVVVSPPCFGGKGYLTLNTGMSKGDGSCTPS